LCFLYREGNPNASIKKKSKSHSKKKREGKRKKKKIANKPYSKDHIDQSICSNDDGNNQSIVKDDDDSSQSNFTSDATEHVHNIELE